MRGVIRKTLGLTAGLMLLVPASALAGQASVVDGIPRYDAYSGEANSVTVSESPGLTPSTKNIIFQDVVPVDAGPGCGQFGPNAAACLVSATTSLVRAGLGNGNDRLEPANPIASFRFSAEGDLGDDVLIGTHNRDVLDGVGGNDTLRGRNANDALEGAAGNDDLRGDAGPDSMKGGTGDDVLNGDDNAEGDSIDCGEDWGDDDFALYNEGDELFTNCERVLEG